MKHVRTFSILKLTLLLNASIVFASSKNDSIEKPFIVKSLNKEAVQNLIIKTTSGEIFIQGDDSNSRIEVYVTPKNGYNMADSKKEIEAKIKDEYNFQLAIENQTLTAIAVEKLKIGDKPRFLIISFKIYLSYKASTHIKTSGGNITLQGLAGLNNTFRTSNGSLFGRKLSGKITGSASSGNIDIADSKDTFDIHCSSGSIAIDNSQGIFKLKTSNEGLMKLTNLNGSIKGSTGTGSLYAKNIEGDFTAQSKRGHITIYDLDCNLNASSKSGGIFVTMKSLRNNLIVNSKRSDVELHLPGNKGMNLDIQGRLVQSNIRNDFAGKSDEHHIEGKLNGGGTMVLVKTKKGGIVLNLE